MELAFMAEGRGEAPKAADKGSEASKAKRTNCPGWKVKISIFQLTANIGFSERRRQRQAARIIPGGNKSEVNAES